MPGVRFASKDELLPLQPHRQDDNQENDDDDDDDAAENMQFASGGLNATTKTTGSTKQESMVYHWNALRGHVFESIHNNFHSYRNREPSIRSQHRAKLNVIFASLLLLTLIVLLSISGILVYYNIYLPRHRQYLLEESIRQHAEAARMRVQQCQDIDWETACDNLGNSAGARHRSRKLYSGKADRSNELEDKYLFSDDPTVTYNEQCLRVYRLQLFGNITFPYHASQLLHTGGNYTMALFIQHGAMRNADAYFCSFKKLMLLQKYRKFEDILIIAPDFNYEHDELVHPRDAFWNSSKPWGDWRVGAESDPKCCGNLGDSHGGGSKGGGGDHKTVSSFEVLDTMLAMLTNRKLFPRMNKISYVGHSAGKFLFIIMWL